MCSRFQQLLAYIKHIVQVNHHCLVVFLDFLHLQQLYRIAEKKSISKIIVQ